jgi:diacylglycerol kinase (ATP)
MSHPHIIHSIINPVAGGGGCRRPLRIAGAFASRHGWSVREYITQRKGHARELAAALPDDGAPLLVFGGDGTLNEVINGLQPRSHPLGLIPCGTGNDFARVLGIRSVQQTLDALASGCLRRVDAAAVDVLCIDEGKLRRTYINALGVGFDAAVATDVSRVKRGKGMLPYLVSVFRVLRRYEAVQARVSWKGTEISTSLFLACIGNGTSSGGGFRLTPDALPDDAALDLCLVSSVSVARVLRVLPRAFNGSHVHAPEVRMGRAARFEIALHQPLPLHLDGEILTMTAQRLEVCCLPAVYDFFVNPSRNAVES